MNFELSIYIGANFSKLKFLSIYGGLNIMNRNKILKIVFILIVIIIILFRTIEFPNSIQEMNCDEIMTVANAVSISETGQDINNIKNPVYLLGWGGQSVVLLYLMTLSMKLFGYSLFAVRLPLLVVSLLSAFIFYDLTKKLTKNNTIAKIALIIVLISPWHILQSLWALDCNMFPHALLFAIYLFYISVEEKKNKLLYVSMIFFAITLYCYGIAMYFVPLFLVVLMLYLLKTKKVNFKQLIICFFIFTILALPIVITFVINILQIKKSITFCNITMPYYEYLARTNDMLFFSENIFTQLKENIIATLKIIIFQCDNCIWNASPNFGTIYHISLVFIIISIFNIINRIKNKKMNLSFFIITEWLIISLLTGFLINDTNINRLNSIWYPLMLLTAYGIYILSSKIKLKKLYASIITSIYLILFILYIVFFNTSYSKEISNSGCFSRGFIQTLGYISTLDTKQQCVYTNFENDGCLQFYTAWQNAKNNNKKDYICVKEIDEIHNIINNFDNNTVLIVKLHEINLPIFNSLQILTFGEYSVIST